MPLKREDMEKIVQIQLDRLAHRLRDREVSLTWEAEVLTHLAEEGYDPFFGARPLKRLIQQDAVNMLSKAILEGKIVGPCAIKLVFDKKEKAIRYELKP